MNHPWSSKTLDQTQFMNRGLTLNWKLIKLENFFVLFLMGLTPKQVIVSCLEIFPASNAISH